jgi:hypothetical protein
MRLVRLPLTPFFATVQIEINCMHGWGNQKYLTNAMWEKRSRQEILRGEIVHPDRRCLWFWPQSAWIQQFSTVVQQIQQGNLQEQGDIEPTKLTVQTWIGLAVVPNYAVETIGPANPFLLCPPFLTRELMKTSTPAEGIGGGRLSRAAQRAAEQTSPLAFLVNVDPRSTAKDTMACMHFMTEVERFLLAADKHLCSIFGTSTIGQRQTAKAPTICQTRLNDDRERGKKTLTWEYKKIVRRKHTGDGDEIARQN